MYKIVYEYKDECTVDWNETTVIVGTYTECIELIKYWSDCEVRVISVEKFN